MFWPLCPLSSKQLPSSDLKPSTLRSSFHFPSSGSHRSNKTMRDQNNNSTQAWFTKCMKAPIRFLAKAKRFYVNGITDCSGRFPYLHAAMGCPVGQLSALPRSFSARSSSVEDYNDLVKAAAAKTYGSRVDFEAPAKQPPVRVPRSHSVVIGRIDEDKPCDFGEDLLIRPNIYPRSKSYAARRRSSGVV